MGVYSGPAGKNVAGAHAFCELDRDADLRRRRLPAGAELGGPVCETVNADVTVLADAIGYDDPIGRKFLGAGLGFGGGCLPKDIRAFVARAAELGADQAVAFLREVDSINFATTRADGPKTRAAKPKSGCC